MASVAATSTTAISASSSSGFFSNSKIQFSRDVMKLLLLRICSKLWGYFIVIAFNLCYFSYIMGHVAKWRG